MSRALTVYLHDRLAGVLTQDDQGNLSFAYDAGYLASPAARRISISMPLREALFLDAIARPFFSGLLPDDRARQQLASFLGLSQDNPFALLAAVGGECAGALAFYPEGVMPPDPTAGSCEVLEDGRLAMLLEKLKSRPLLAGEDGVRLSLAGAQSKLPVCLVDGRIALAKGGTPTTHILKPVIEGLDGTVENEAFCLALAKRMQLDVPHAEIRRVDEMPCYLVERYDRTTGADGAVMRLHQEDFCQALGVRPELKYEEEGGPGVSAVLGLLQEHAARPAVDRLAFIRLLIFNYLIGNADAHGKNYSLLYHGNTPSLAPAYDLLSTAVYPRLDKKMAMKIGGRNVADTVHFEHWKTLVPNTKLAQKALADDLHEMAGRIQGEAEVLVAGFSEKGVSTRIPAQIQGIIQKRARHLSACSH